MRPYRVKPYTVPPWIHRALLSLRPAERLPVSKWAEKWRVLPDTNAIPGPFRNSVTPYLAEIMDAFSNEDVERIVFVKPTQVGGTTALENMLASAVDQDPAPAMIVYPSDKLAERTVEAKLEPMIRQCKPLAAKYREAESQKLKLKFETMFVFLSGANSPASLSSTPIRYLFLDEVDKFPGASKKEADPVSLAIERTKTYTTNRKIFMASTPTLKSGHIWKAKEEAEAEKHYRGHRRHPDGYRADIRRAGGMKKLIAKRPVLYLGRMYDKGDTLPANDQKMVTAWLNAKSAAWDGQEAKESRQEAQESAKQADGSQDSRGQNGGQEAQENGQGAEMVEGHLDPDQLATMKKAGLEKLAARLGVDISGAKNNKERAELIAATTVQAPANETGGAH